MEVKPKLASALESGKAVAEKGKEKGKELLEKGKVQAKVAAVASKEKGSELLGKLKLLIVPLILKFVIFYRKEFVEYLTKESEKSTNKLDDLAVAGFAKVLEVLAAQQEVKKEA